MRKPRYIPEPVEMVTLRPGFSFTTVKRAVFTAGEAYPATVNEGRSLFNLTHPETGEIASFTGREVVAVEALVDA